MEENKDLISNNRRIEKNTLMLYFRQILIMLVSLYTVRVVLNTLGAENYGIYNVVAGVVTMFSFLSGAMATASQRFFSFAMGKSDIYEIMSEEIAFIQDHISAYNGNFYCRVYKFEDIQRGNI